MNLYESIKDGYVYKSKQSKDLANSKKVLLNAATYTKIARAIDDACAEEMDELEIQLFLQSIINHCRDTAEAHDVLVETSESINNNSKDKDILDKAASIILDKVSEYFYEKDIRVDSVENLIQNYNPINIEVITDGVAEDMGVDSFRCSDEQERYIYEKVFNALDPELKSGSSYESKVADYIFENFEDLKFNPKEDDDIPEEDIQAACNALKVPRDSVNPEKVHLLFKELWNKYL